MVGHAAREERLVVGAGALDLAGLRVQALRDARLPGADEVTGPHQPVRHQHVRRGVVAFLALAAPQTLAVLRGERDQLAHGRPPAGAGDDPLDLATVVGVLGLPLGHRPIAGEDHVAVYDERRGRPRWPAAAHRPLRPPDLAPRGGVQADDLVGALEEHAPAADGQRRGHQLGRVGVGLRPEHAPAGGVDRHQAFQRRHLRVLRPLGADRREARMLPTAPCLRRLPLARRAAGHHEEPAFVADELQRPVRSFVRGEGPARGRVQRAERLAEAERYIHAVAHGDQAPGQLGRAAAEAPQVVLPLRDRALPEKHPAECVPRRQLPFRLQRDGGGRALIGDVEDPPARRDGRTHARQVVVASRPGGVAHPLHVDRRRDDRIARDRVVRRVVHVVRPLVDLLRPRLDRPGPPAVLLDVRHAVGAQDSHDFRHGDLARVFRDDEVDQVVGVRQPLAAEPIHRHLAVQAELADVLAGPGRVRRVGVQTVHQVAVVCAQRRRQLPVPAAEVHDQSAAHARGVEYAASRGLRVRLGGRRRRADIAGPREEDYRADQAAVPRVSEWRLLVHA